MRKVLFLSGCLLSAVYCLLVVGGCGKKEAPPATEKVIVVHVQPAEQRSLRPFIQSVGTLNPREEVVISCEVDGILKEVYVNEGSVVSKGHLLAVIDDTDYVLEVKRAEAALKQCEATLANSRMEYQRKESLYREQLVTQQQFDDVSTRVLFGEAEVERAKASLSLARQRLSKTKISSPLSGVVKERKVERGNFVKNGTPLITVIDSNPIKLNFTVTERDLSRLKKNQEVVFTVAAYPDKEFKGTLNIIYPSLVENTRSLQVEALAPNQQGLLKPGLFAQVLVYTGSARDVILVPATSLLYEGEQVKVFIADGDRARERVVSIGQKYRLPVTASGHKLRRESDKPHEAIRSSPGVEVKMQEFTEIIDGVRSGERIITVGQQNLFDGAKITVVNEQAPVN